MIFIDDNEAAKEVVPVVTDQEDIEHQNVVDDDIEIFIDDDYESSSSY